MCSQPFDYVTRLSPGGSTDSPANPASLAKGPGDAGNHPSVTTAGDLGSSYSFMRCPLRRNPKVQPLGAAAYWDSNNRGGFLVEARNSCPLSPVSCVPSLSVQEHRFSQHVGDLGQVLFDVVERVHIDPLDALSHDVEILVTVTALSQDHETPGQVLLN